MSARLWAWLKRRPTTHRTAPLAAASVTMASTPTRRLRVPRLDAEVWCVAYDGTTEWHDDKAAALARVDALVGRGCKPFAYPVRVESQESA